MLKRFLLFTGPTYYPCGGWGDFKESFDTEQEAKDYLLTNHKFDDWWEIVDTTTLEAVSGSE